MRQQNGRRRQAVKQVERGSLFSRQEWETPVTGDPGRKIGSPLQTSAPDPSSNRHRQLAFGDCSALPKVDEGSSECVM